MTRDFARRYNQIAVGKAQPAPMAASAYGCRPRRQHSRQSDTSIHDRLVLIPGDGWSSAWNWWQTNRDLLIDDPAGHIMYEAHQYFDQDHSGAYKSGYDLNTDSPDRAIELVRPFVDWLRQHQVRGIITEFGVPANDSRWFDMTQRLLAYLANEKIPWTYWAGGPMWGNYPLSTEPKNGRDAPVMSILTKDYGMPGDL